MSLPAAAVPLAVLVLAWDETAPAVRALVEATETAAAPLDSVVVLVPAATGEPVQEEFLPLEVEPIALEATTEAAPLVEAAKDTSAEQVEPPLPGLLATTSTAEPTSSTAPTPPSSGSSAEASLQPVLPPALLAPLAWSEVRVLRLSSFGLHALTELSNQALPRPIWQSSLVLPAAPYLGSQAAVVGSQAGTDMDQAEIGPTTTVHPVLPEDTRVSLPPTPPVLVQPAQSLPEPAAPDYLLAELSLPSLDAEADLAPILPDEPATDDFSSTEAPLAEVTGRAQAGWSEALASLRVPLPLDEPASVPEQEEAAAYYTPVANEIPAAASTSSADFQLVSKPFDAPDLNFQVIQYARFAVPVALAQVPFAAIYAPAWPTWLAAQELRHRTRQPLVLHVATLAAGEDQSLASATGWQAELQRQALQRADLILAETPELTRRLRHDLDLAPELVRTVPAADAAAVAQALRTAQLRISRDAA